MKKAIKLGDLKNSLGKDQRFAKLARADKDKQTAYIDTLDPEARKMFQGLLNITSNIANQTAAAENTKRATKIREPVVETPIEPPIEAETVFNTEPQIEVKAAGVFDLVRKLMEAMARHDYVAAHTQVRALTQNRDLDNTSRAALVPVGNGIARLYYAHVGKDRFAADEAPALVAKINEQLSNIVSRAAYNAESIASEDFNFVGAIETNLPASVEDTLHITDITLVVLPDRTLPAGPRVRPLASNVYLIETTLVGVSTDIPAERRLTAAEAYSVSTLHASVLPTSLSRPDSDATWFPVFNHVGISPIRSFTADIIQFPDQARRYYGASSASSEVEAAARQSKALRLASIRGDFERQYADQYAELDWAQKETTDCSAEALALGAAFYERYSNRWQTTFENLVAGARRLLNEDLELAGDDMARRYWLHNRFEERCEVMKAEQLAIVNLRLRIKVAKASVERLTAEIEELKRAVRDPYSVSIGDKIAAMAGG